MIESWVVYDELHLCVTAATITIGIMYISSLNKEALGGVWFCLGVIIFHPGLLYLKIDIVPAVTYQWSLSWTTQGWIIDPPDPRGTPPY